MEQKVKEALELERKEHNKVKIECESLSDKINIIESHNRDLLEVKSQLLDKI